MASFPPLYILILSFLALLLPSIALFFQALLACWRSGAILCCKMAANKNFWSWHCVGLGSQRLSPMPQLGDLAFLYIDPSSCRRGETVRSFKRSVQM